MAITENAVQFLRGTQNALKTLIANNSGVNGTFYLAEDSHRMYMGIDGGKIVPINDSIISVAAVENLPTTGVYGDAEVGTFYYAAKENVLCIYNGTKWVQINPDTNIKSGALNAKVGTEANSAAIAGTLKDTNNNDITISGVTLKGAGDLLVSVTDNVITLSVGATGEESPLNYNLTVANDTANNKVDVKLIQGANSEKGTVSFAADTTSGLAVSEANGVVTYDGTGLLNKVNQNAQQYQVNAVTGAAAANDKTGFTIGVTQGTDTKSGSIDPIISYGDKQTTHFVNGIASLDVYSKAQVDEQIDAQMRSLNALQYQSTITILPTLAKDIKIGYTYKVANTDGIKYIDSEGIEQTAKYGDLLIANSHSEENSEGNIIADLYWDHVESGDETDTTYSGTLFEHGIAIKKDIGNDNIISVKLSEGTNIVLTDTQDEKNHSNTIEIAHESISTTNDSANPSSGVTQTAKDTVELTVVSGLTIVNGHITEVEYTKHTLTDTDTDTHAHLDSNVYAVSAADKGVTIGNTLKLKYDNSTDTESKNGTFNMVSDNDNLTITAKENQVHVGLYWGTF